MTWGWPQLVVAGLGAIGLAVALAKDGEPKKDKYSFGARLVTTAIWAWLLYEGGFWGAP